MSEPVIPTESDRDRIVERLREHYVAGRLSQAELERRIAAALQAQTIGDLRSLVADLGVSPRTSASKRPPLARVTVDEEYVVVEMIGRARLDTMRKRLAIPVQSITRAWAVSYPEALIPGRPSWGRRNAKVIAGWWVKAGSRLCAVARPGHPALVLETERGPIDCDRLIVQVDDPERLAATIRAWQGK